MPLIQPFFARLNNRFFPLISVIWIGLQLRGYYWILTGVLLLTLFRTRETWLLFFSYTRNIILSALLLILSLSLLVAAAFDSGLQGLVPEISVTLPLLPIFIFSCVPFLQGDKCLPSGSRYLLYAFGVGILTVVSALWQWTHLADSPASSLRPIEIQASSGAFLVVALINSCLFRKFSGDANRLYKISIFILSLALSLISLACFRGVTSASVLVLNIVSAILLLTPSVNSSRFGLFLIGLTMAFSALALTLILDFRFLFLKFLVVPLYSSDIGNGRAVLLKSWIVSYGREPPLLIGAQPSVPTDFFAHNIVVDSLIKDGSVAASSILLFGIVVFFCLSRRLFEEFDKRGFLNLLQFCLMTIPALLQPVQFSHAFAFLLSISTLGILVSRPVDQLPDSPTP